MVDLHLRCSGAVQAAGYLTGRDVFIVWAGGTNVGDPLVLNRLISNLRTGSSTCVVRVGLGASRYASRSSGPPGTGVPQLNIGTRSAV